MPENVESAKVNLIRYVVTNMVLPLLIFFIGTLIGYVVMGLHDSYLDKKLEAQRLAKILAVSATHGDPNLVASQVSLSMQQRQNSAIKDINFYSVEHTIEADERMYSDWSNALFSSSANFYEEVLVKEYDANTDNLHTNNVNNNGVLPGKTDQALMGYINITLDLEQMRRHWFKRHALVVISLITLFSIFLLLIYIRLLLPVRQFLSMVNKARHLVDNNDADVGSLIHSDKKFIELDALTRLIALLDRRYKSLHYDFENLKQRELDIQQQRQASGRSSQFQSMIIHELKGSLYDISDGLHLIGGSYLNDEQASAVATIRKGYHGLSITLNQIIQLNRIEKGQLGVSFGELQPAQMINGLVQANEAYARKKGLSLTANIHHVDYVLAGDVKKVHTIIDELLLNAIKYTDTGSITVDSSMMYFAESIRWTIKVSDTGVGIEQKYLEDIFLPFFHITPADGSETDAMSADVSESDALITPAKSKEEKTGIGLCIARKLTELINGSLTVESEVGVGSTFTLVLQLRSWNHNELFTLLNGVKILALEVQGSEAFTKNLELYGASVKVLTDMFLVIDEAHNKLSDILIMSDKVALDDVVSVCRAIRQQESSHRVLIAWYQSNLASHEVADLEAIGLDYVLDSTISFKSQASTIKRWVMGL